MHKKQLTFQFLFISTLLFSFITISDSIAEENTKVGLPEDAIARLGKGGINIMRFSPDGSYLAVGTDVGVWLYNVQDGTETALFAEDIGHVNALAFSQDGRLLASGGFNNPTIQVWDLDNKSKFSTLTLPQPTVTLSALSFYGRILVSFSSREIIYWKVETNKVLSTIDFSAYFNTSVFSKDGSNFAATDKDKGVRLFDTRISSHYATLPGQGNGGNSEILALDFSPDNKILALGGENRFVSLWKVQNQEQLAILKGHSTWVTAVAFSEDGKTLASGDAGKVIKLWNVETKQQHATIRGHKNTINALTFAPKETPIYGMCLASGSADGTIRLWNTNNGEALTTLATGHTESVRDVAFTENDSNLVSAAFNGTVDVWRLKTHQEIASFDDAHSDNTEKVYLTPNAKHLVTYKSYGSIHFKPVGSGIQSSLRELNNPHFWNIFTGERLTPPMQRVHFMFSAVGFSPDGSILAANNEREIRGWNLITGIEQFQINKDTSSQNGELVFSPDGKKLAVVSQYLIPQIWDIAAKIDITPKGIKGTSSLAFSLDSNILATASRDGIYLWKFNLKEDETHSLIPTRLVSPESELVFSPDNTIIVSTDESGWNNEISLWNLETGLKLGMLSGHTESITALVFSHDGKTLASCSEDGTVLLWDWDNINAKLKADHKGKFNAKTLLPVPQPKEYASKSEEAEAVMNWLNNNGYQINEISSGYSLIRDGSSSSFSGVSGTIRLGDVKVTVNKEILNIDIENIGSGDFIFDADGNLNPKTSDEEKATK